MLDPASASQNRRSNISLIFDKAVYDPLLLWRVANLCGINNGNCSHLCLLDFNSIYKCDCPHVMKLADDKKTCVGKEISPLNYF
ncbi:unnamed protein product [Nezara viridula]|uniref:Uncharacterized protein n=1 Tax=Nezara viridula TaxID=85310 RepID=A0A9P0H487_NEZVI|nr:unnamed protein product [Nezara viridula]